jgi:hypothetical protein
MSDGIHNLEQSILEWKEGRLSNGHRLALPEHHAILMVGRKVDETSRPAGLNDSMWKIIEGVQLDALPGVEQLAKKFEVSALEIAFYRQLWGTADDEVLPGVVYRRVLVSRRNSVPEPIIQDFRKEVDHWRVQLQSVRSGFESDVPDGLAMQSAEEPTKN